MAHEGHGTLNTIRMLANSQAAMSKQVVLLLHVTAWPQQQVGHWLTLIALEGCRGGANEGSSEGKRADDAGERPVRRMRAAGRHADRSGESRGAACHRAAEGVTD